MSHEDPPTDPPASSSPANARAYLPEGSMNRRTKHLPHVPDRRKNWFDRRQHGGPFRWLWIPVGELARRAATSILAIF